LGSLWKDVKYALRILAKSPGFTAVAVLTLALGIGANAAIFSVVNGVLLNPLPYPHPDRQVMVYESSPQFHRMSVAYLNFRDWQRESRSFSGMAIVRGYDFLLTGNGEASRIVGKRVSAGFFSVLGVSPVLGRGFLQKEDEPGANPVAIITDSFWKRHFGGAKDVLGRSLMLDGQSYTIVGVLPQGFEFQRKADVYLPMGQWDSELLQNRGTRPGLRVVARLAPGVTLAQAQQEMAGIGRQLAARYPKDDAGHGVTVVSLHADMVHGLRTSLLVLFGAVGFVLLIACGNVANLLLARANARRREFALRGALGASRARLMRQLLTEGVVLSLAGGALGLLVAVWGTQAALGAVPGGLPRVGEIHVDARVVLFLFGVSLLAGVLFALAPALRGSDAELNETLKEGSRSVARGHGRLQRALIVGEVAMSLVLLVGAGLMLRTLGHLWEVDPGFNPHEVLTMNVALASDTASHADKIRLGYRQLLERIGRIPGVDSAAVCEMLPLSGSDDEWSLWFGSNATPPPQDQRKISLAYIVTPEYRRMLRIPLIRGRFIADADNEHSPHVIVVDTVFAREFFPNENPIGKQVQLSLGSPAQIVGVVGHVHHWGLGSDDNAKIRAQFYYPLYQVPDAYMSQGQIGLTLAVRTRTSPLAATAAIRDAVLGPGRDQPVYNVETMEQMIAESLAERRFSMLLLGLFAALALVLAGVGIYGVISYSVSQRTHEIGIRMALGAAPREVLRLVVGEGMRLVLAGLAIGVLAAIALTRFLAGMLYGVTATDPATFLAVVLLLALVALGACWIPALRATRVAPTTALHYE
jgi:predicted permease